ncbi:multifunctional CCA protein [Marinobacterium zhoushanense]|uniref:CCA-adding enzyme n=1 Tax=Marinobacterium zhoushanense TaxID=1679163 RepID=A0ABQ1KR51_9GAMM|nr:multifunctional CCA protein [Marinobacterium zhoushanense]
MEIYLVGGAVRDRLLGLGVKDRDWVVVGATPEQMLDAGFKQVGKDFPVFLHPDSGEEYALARTERKSGKGYTGFDFYANPEVTLEEDLCRRDLTINAIAEDSEGNLVDPYGGQQDLQQRLLRHVSPAFSEDPLRVLRVARFAARFASLGFHIAPETLELMRELSAGDELSHLTAERVWQEFERALATQSPITFIEVLNAVGACEQLLAELCELDTTDAKQRSAALAARSSTAEQQFALLLAIATQNEGDKRAIDSIEALCRRLKSPNRYRDLALQLRRWHNALAGFESLTAIDQLQLIKQLDLLRRPERLAQLRPCVEALHLDLEITAPTLEPLLERLRTLSPQELMAEGFSGKALGEELERRQLAICAGLAAGNQSPDA